MKHIFSIVLWALTGMGLFILLISAMYRNGQLRCTKMDIVIDDYKHEIFISEKDIEKMLDKELNQHVAGSPLRQLDLRKLESLLEQNRWIEKSQLFIDNHQVLHVYIKERTPVARIFTKGGMSFYIDEFANILPLSSHASADVPVFTNMADETVLSPSKDTMLWNAIRRIGSYIKKDSLLLMQIGQIYIQSPANYVMYPTIGTHQIIFGTAADYERKLNNLSSFYKKVFGKVGLNTYEVIDVRYDKQLVATRSEAVIKIKTDSVNVKIPGAQQINSVNGKVEKAIITTNASDKKKESEKKQVKNIKQPKSAGRKVKAH